MGKKYQTEHKKHAEPANCKGQAEIDTGWQNHNQSVDVLVVAEIEKCEVAEASCDTYETAMVEENTMQTYFRAGVSQGVYRFPDPPPLSLSLSKIIQILIYGAVYKFETSSTTSLAAHPWHELQNGNYKIAYSPTTFNQPYMYHAGTFGHLTKPACFSSQIFPWKKIKT